MNLELVDGKFRNLTDLLLFSNREDLDINEYVKYLNDKNNLNYFFNAFKLASDIYWEEFHKIWNYKFHFILSLNKKSINVFVKNFLLKKVNKIIKEKNFKNWLNYKLFIEYCRVKHEKKHNVSFIRDYILQLSGSQGDRKVISIVNDLIPYAFMDLNHYSELLMDRIETSYKYLNILYYLNKYGLLDKKRLADKVIDIILGKSVLDRAVGLVLRLFCDNEIYDIVHNHRAMFVREELIKFVEKCDIDWLERNNFELFGKISRLHDGILNRMVEIFLDKLYNGNWFYISHARMNVDKIIKLMKNVPEVSIKKIVLWLSSNGSMKDLKFLFKLYPETGKLSLLV